MSTLKRYNGTSWETIGGSITGDTLPIGSEIDYTGSSVPAGWEEVADYSTNEIDTGKKWIDGKPIYRKVIHYSGTATGTYKEIAHNINNIGTHRVVIDQAFIYGGNSFCGYKSANEFVDVAVIDNTNIGVGCGSDWSSLFTEAYITLEYTKTTD